MPFGIIPESRSLWTGFLTMAQRERDRLVVTLRNQSLVCFLEQAAEELELCRFRRLNQQHYGRYLILIAKSLSRSCPAGSP